MKRIKIIKKQTAVAEQIVEVVPDDEVSASHTDERQEVEVIESWIADWRTRKAVTRQRELDGLTSLSKIK